MREVLDILIGAGIIIGAFGMIRTSGRRWVSAPYATLFLLACICSEYYPPAGDAHRPGWPLWCALAFTTAVTGYQGIQWFRAKIRR